MNTTKRTSNTAWNFLRRNAEYKENWCSRAISKVPKKGGDPFDLYDQNHSDISARKWGLFAYADPTLSSEVVSPFWSITPILEAEIVPNGKSALLPMLRKTGAVISGLLLLDGDLILKVEREGASVQVRIKNGKDFTKTSGLTLHLPLDLMLPVRLTRSLDFWNIVAGERFKKVENLIKQITMSFSSFLMACSMAKAIAR